MGLALDFSVGTISTIFFYWLSYRIALKLFPKTKDIYFTADAVFGVFYYPLLVFLAADASFKLAFEVENRWFGKTDSSRWLAVAITSRMIVHLGFLQLKKMSSAERATFLIHHGFCIAVYGGGYINSKCHFWGAFTAMCEVTNVFLTFLELYMSSETKGELLKSMDEIVPSPGRNITSKNTKLSKGKRNQKTSLYKTNSILLCVSYAIFRIVLFPVFLIMWLYDVYSYPEATWHHPDIGLMEQYLYPFTAMLMLSLSINWFFPIYNGTLKTLGYRISKSKMRELVPESYARHEHIQ